MRSESTNPSHALVTGRVRERGLTLVEILAVVVILGFLAATLAVGFSGSFGKAKHELAKTGIAQIVDKVEAYRIEKGVFPTNDLGLRALSDGQAVPTDSFFLEAGKLLDPWKRPYYYLTPGPNQFPYEILTYGADGAPGGTGEDADVTSVDLRGEK
jgi:general secretion pathway protein G